MNKPRCRVCLASLRDDASCPFRCPSQLAKPHATRRRTESKINERQLNKSEKRLWLTKAEADLGMRRARRTG